MTRKDKWILYDNRQGPAQWLDWEEAPEYFPKLQTLLPKVQSTSQSQTCTKTRSWSLFDGLLPVWSTTAFWILVKPLHWALSSVNRWDAPKTAVPTASIGQQKRLNSSPQQHPTSCRTTSASNVEWIGLQSFASSTVFPWTLYNELPLLQASRQLFAGGMLSKSSSNPEARIFMLQE